MRWPKRTGSGTLHIRNLEPEDIDFALSLTTAEGWSYTRGELERMLRMDPQGSFLYEDKDPLAFVTCVTYSHTGVVGHLVVSKEARGRRIGHSLLKRAVDYMSERGVDSMLLYATLEGVPLYSRLGFAVRREVSCIHVAAGRGHGAEAGTSCELVSEEDLREIARIDSRIFGDDRSQLIDLLYEEFPENAFKIRRDGSIVGFSFGRRTPTGFDLGPWVCLSGSKKDAEDLFSATVSSLGEGTVYLGVFVDNLTATEIADSFKKVRTWRTQLMIKGKERYDTDIDKLFGVAAFELG